MRGGLYKLMGGKIVTRYWPLVLGGWILLAMGLQTIAPPWEQIAADGDLAFLPSTAPSAIGQRALDNAFPGVQSRSQMVLVFANQQQELSTGDLSLAMDLTRRLHWFAAKNAWQGIREPAAEPLTLAANQQATHRSEIRQSFVSEIVKDNLTEAIEIDDQLSRFLGTERPKSAFARLPDAYQIRGEVLAMLGEQEQAAADLDTAKLMQEQAIPTLENELPAWAPAIRDVWSWRNSVIGHKLGSADRRARLVTIQLSNDFTATDNIDVLNGIEALIKQLKDEYADLMSDEFQVEVSGSAAVGADMLRAAASGVRKTEAVTVILVLLILATVYRAPFLVAIPLTSIALSLVVATSLVALLARDPSSPGDTGLGVFTTTRIFIVVLLFGVGTDFCLFFLSRNRELLQNRSVRTRGQMYRVVAKGWRSVHDALVASALTTIVGLALMWFSHFEKFQFSGPIIAISLAITLLVCLTFTPALLSALGKTAFWPLLRRSSSGRQSISDSGGWNRYWAALAEAVVSRPAKALVVTLAVLAVPATYGLVCLGYVTYDLTEELSESAPSRRGAKLISEFFPTQDGSPVTILLTREEPFESDEGLRDACSALSATLYTDGVDSVRSLTDPLGDYPPGKRMSLFDKDAWRRRLLLGHRITQERYISSVNVFSQRVAKFDLILKDNPFSLAASATLERVKELLRQEIIDPNSPWSRAQIATTGTTVGVTDLRHVTQSDQRRIQVLVTLGVWLVLVILLRQVVLSTYLIFTVLLSYFATLGITYWTFSTLYSQYSGLDWKVPLFLFVILVAVGQDYNVYLVTRIFEERRTAGLREGVRRALQLTGGIITSCGLVMAGTFVAMTSPAVLHWLAGVLPAGWLDSNAPVLRGITELGFALAFGVLLDTLVVRSILVPAFIVLWQRRREAKWLQRGDLPQAIDQPRSSRNDRLSNAPKRHDPLADS